MLIGPRMEKEVFIINHQSGTDRTVVPKTQANQVVTRPIIKKISKHIPMC